MWICTNDWILSSHGMHVYQHMYGLLCWLLMNAHDSVSVSCIQLFCIVVAPAAEFNFWQIFDSCGRVNIYKKHIKAVGTARGDCHCVIPSCHAGLAWQQFDAPRSELPCFMLAQGRRLKNWRPQPLLEWGSNIDSAGLRSLWLSVIWCICMDSSILPCLHRRRYCTTNR